MPLMKSNNTKAVAARLRQRIEELLKKKKTNTNTQPSEGEMIKLIYDLETHLKELELQNDELIIARSKALEVAEKYIELYNSAPSGYLTLSKEGAIIEINLCAAQMLGKERTRLANSLFSFFVSEDTKPIFNFFLWKVFTSNAKESCEVTLTTNASTSIYTSLAGIISKDEEYCLVTIMDITDKKKVEAELEKWATIFKPKAN
jgi:PAS domain S-box-containing protein